jgi:BON domain
MVPPGRLRSRSVCNHRGVARRRKPRFLRGFLYGMLAAYFLDPQLGHGRRALARDRLRSRLRRAIRRGERVQRYAAATARGKTQAFLHRREMPKPPPDDATLAHKVETIVFRDPGVPKGQISVNAEDGVVWLRGEVPSQAMLDALVERTRSVAGVRRVESLLHLPGQPAPMHR